MYAECCGPNAAASGGDIRVVKNPIRGPGSQQTAMVMGEKVTMGEGDGKIAVQPLTFLGERSQSPSMNLKKVNGFLKVH
jgi:hypothetical protein